MQLPDFPAHLPPDERRAVCAQAAHDMVEDAIRENDLDRSNSKVMDLVGDARVSILLHWPGQRVDALEAAQGAKE